MRRIFIFSLFVLSILLTTTACQQGTSGEETDSSGHHDHATENVAEGQTSAKPLSPRTNAMANIGAAHVHINYSSPSVRGRTIWGGLVAFDQVWVTGAHSATSIDSNKDVSINNQTIPAGTYGFFTIPGKEEWTLILNKNYKQHLADDYSQAEDLLRLQVVPEQLPEIMEALTYEVQPLAEEDN